MRNYYLGIFFLIGLKSMVEIEAKDECANVTIFVHGTHRTQHALGYIPGVAPYVYHKEGLYKTDECLDTYCYRRLANSITTSASFEFPLEHFYLFCWSGVLSHTGRVAAAYQLHEALNNLVVKYNNKCKITLITHSHGGNVVLNLVGVQGERNYVIDTLLLLAVPVQHITKSYIDSDIFKNIFSFYSRWDLLQIGDPQGLGYQRRLVRRVFTRQGQEKSDLEEIIPLFSQRRFVSTKVKHVEIVHSTWFGSRPISHIEFILPHFTRNLGTILKKAHQHDFTQNPHLIFSLEKNSLFESLFG